MPDKHRIEVTYGLATLNPEARANVYFRKPTWREIIHSLVMELFWQVFMPALAFTCFFSSFWILANA